MSKVITLIYPAVQRLAYEFRLQVKDRGNEGGLGDQVMKDEDGELITIPCVASCYLRMRM